MRHTTHVIFSMFFITAVAEAAPPLLDLVPYGYALAIAMFATLLPDIDHPHSYISRSYWGVFTPIVMRTTHHRGWTHSLTGSVIFTTIFAVILQVFGSDPVYSIPFFLGYVAHLISDSLNPTGVNWLWPKNGRLRIGHVRTGSEGENIFQKIALLLFVGVLVFDTMWGGGMLLNG
ncbi:MAG: metal-dependent hydrolase [Methanoculleaceae archaeon]